MSSIFTLDSFTFPYTYKFPGQGTHEKILFITRENPVMLNVRRGGVLVAALAVFITGYALSAMVSSQVGEQLAFSMIIVSILTASVFGTVGWWWITTLWMKSVCIITTQRLTKYIYTTPFNRHILSLPLEMIVDTGAYTKGFLQAVFKLGTFTARSSATSSGVATDDEGRVNKKYFYIENIAVAEDLQHYVNKLLYAYRHHHDHLETFRPFIPHLKGDSREHFMKDFPEYWS